MYEVIITCVSVGAIYPNKCITVIKSGSLLVAKAAFILVDNLLPELFNGGIRGYNFFCNVYDSYGSGCTPLARESIKKFVFQKATSFYIFKDSPSGGLPTLMCSSEFFHCKLVFVFLAKVIRELRSAGWPIPYAVYKICDPLKEKPLVATLNTTKIGNL